MAAQNGDAEQKAEGAIFAAAVLPQLHKCSPAVAQAVYDEMSLNSDNTVDFNAVKTAIESCYKSMDITCADVGGYLDESTTPPSYFRSVVGDVAYDASPCADVGGPVESILDLLDDGDDDIPTWGIVVIVIVSLLCLILLIIVCSMVRGEKQGKPFFSPLDFPVTHAGQTIENKKKEIGSA